METAKEETKASIKNYIKIARVDHWVEVSPKS